jgi:hypothetical protein
MFAENGGKEKSKKKGVEQMRLVKMTSIVLLSSVNELTNTYRFTEWLRRAWLVVNSRKTVPVVRQPKKKNHDSIYIYDRYMIFPQPSERYCDMKLSRSIKKI